MRGVVVEATLLLAAWLVVAAHGLCRPGHTWWNSDQELCLNCTRCETLHPPLLVLRPCQLYQDALCAPLNRLDIDWSWLSTPKKNKNNRTHKRKNRNQEQNNDSNKTKNRKIKWRFMSADEAFKETSNNQIRPEVQVTKGVDEDDSVPSESDEINSEEVDVKMESNAFTPEEVVWFEQTMLLTFVASVCVVFFFIVTAYSVYHTMQWKKIKKNIQTDVEGLSAKINLMMASGECSSQELMNHPPHYSNIRCAYLEQLLVGKCNERRPGPGNVYIQENNS